MFSQKPCYFSQLSRAYPFLKLVDIYDRQSFVRTYILDNIYICILMYFLFYAALWYATNIIRRIEESNREMSTTIAENKTKLDRLIMLKNKKAQFEEVIVKTTDTQKVTTRQLEDEMHRLSTELITTSNKIAHLEKFIEKMVFSTSAQTNLSYIPPTSSRLARTSVQKDAKEARVRSKTLRSSSRRFRRLYHRNRHPGSTGSLSLDRLGNAERHLQRHLQLHRQRSDSNNSASAENSSESAVRYRANRIIARCSNYQDGDKTRHYHSKRFSKACSRRCSCFNVDKIHVDSLMNITPFTRSVLGLANVFHQRENLQ